MDSIIGLLLCLCFCFSLGKANSFDKESYEWKLFKSSLNSNGVQDVCSAEFNKKIYIFGGWNLEPDYFNNLYEFDPSNDTLTLLNPQLNVELNNTYGCSMSKVGNRLLIAGGSIDEYKVVNDTYWFDPVAMTWTPGKPLPRPVCWHSATVLNDDVYLFFGWSTPQYNHTECYSLQGCLDNNWIQIYHSSNDSWTLLEKPVNLTEESWPSNREGIATAKAIIPSYSPNPVILSYGGACIGCQANVIGKFFRDLWIFFPENRTFLNLILPNQKYRAFTSFNYFRGSIWSFGGSTVDPVGLSYYYNDTFLLDFEYQNWTDYSKSIDGDSPTQRWSVPSVNIDIGDEDIDGIYIIGGSTNMIVYHDIFRIAPVSHTEVKKRNNTLKIALGIVIPIVFIIILVGVTLILLKTSVIRKYKRKFFMKEFEEKSKSQTATDIQMQTKTPSQTEPQMKSQTEFPVETSGTNYSAITPTSVFITVPTINSEDLKTLKESKPNESENSWQIDFGELVIETKIGQGGYGEVYKGEWRHQKVAVKKVISEMAKEEFIEEAKLMLRLKPHDNVVLLMGVCINPFCIVIKYCEKGNLLSYLRNETEALEWQLQLKLMKGIAAGVNHLHREMVIHRDLACRNILLSSKMDAIVSDFGFARLVKQDTDVATTQSNVGPIKHMAIESIRNRIYSEKTDCWSFGVTCWEIITKGEEPFKGQTHLQSAALVLSGKRLTIPDHVHPKITEMIKQCWEKDPQLRPSLQECYEILESVEKL